MPSLPVKILPIHPPSFLSLSPINVYIGIQMYTDTDTFMHASYEALSYIYIHTHIYIYLHTHTYIYISLSPMHPLGLSLLLLSPTVLI
jgi:hypothetical protein